jgi:hypothetical protein
MLGLMFSVVSGSAHAGLTTISITDGYYYHQTATGVSLYGAFFDAGAYSQNPSDFNSGTLNFPGTTSPQTLIPYVGTFGNPSTQYMGFESGFKSPSAISSNYPFGVYTFTLSNSANAAMQTASLDYTQNAFTTDIPTLSSASFAALQHADANQPLTLLFNSFTPNAAATKSGFQLKFIDLTTNTSFLVDSPAPASTTSVLLNPGTFKAGNSYEYIMAFNDSILGNDAVSGIKTSQAFVVRTYGFFATAPVPEPDVYALMLSGLGLIGFAARRRQRAHV